VFPTNCRWCSRSIYLFATPEGGFVIFDEVGEEWPKHECFGVQQSRLYGGESRSEYALQFHFSGPHKATEAVPRSGKVTGTVIGQSENGGVWTTRIFDGKQVLVATANSTDLVGRSIRGLIANRDGEAVLEVIDILSIDEIGSAYRRSEPGRIGPLQRKVGIGPEVPAREAVASRKGMDRPTGNYPNLSAPSVPGPAGRPSSDVHLPDLPRGIVMRIDVSSNSHLRPLQLQVNLVRVAGVAAVARTAESTCTVLYVVVESLDVAERLKALCERYGVCCRDIEMTQ
jgi:hypothetical protein